jgi:hypothetical protein
MTKGEGSVNTCPDLHPLLDFIDFPVYLVLPGTKITLPSSQIQGLRHPQP